jgi:glycosyltransferase involved in cell wall biosynthesis
MHVLFIHPNFPSQFFPIAMHLSRLPGWQATLLSSVDTSHLNLPFNHAAYRLQSGPLPKVFYNPETLTGLMEHLAPIYYGLKNSPQLRPDLVVGHISYGTWLYLRNLYDCPFVGYYEILPPPFWSEGLVLRKEFPPPEQIRLFNATFHTLTYLHLHAMDAGYTPTNYQLGTAPPELRHKLRVIFDGVDANIFQRRSPRPTEFRGLTIGPDTRVITYVSRGLESIRGFDIFMKAARIIERQVPNTLFLIAGTERTNYGHELHHIGNQSFKQWVLAQDTYDPARYRFLDLVSTPELVTMLNLSDVHFYLTVPYVLSWSLINAMACECTIVGSATAPVQEAVDDGVHGLLADFYDVEGLADRAVRVLRDPNGHRHLGQNARQRVLERYEGNRCNQQLVEFFEELLKRPKVEKKN